MYKEPNIKTKKKCLPQKHKNVAVLICQIFLTMPTCQCVVYDKDIIILEVWIYYIRIRI